jgi:hypothetical protein
MLDNMLNRDISFANRKKLLLEITLIYQMMAKVSDFLEGNYRIDMEELDQKYQRIEDMLLNLIEEKSYDRSLVDIRKAEIKRHRENFNLYKSDIVKSVMDSLMAIRESSINDSEVPKTYHLLA